MKTVFSLLIWWFVLFESFCQAQQVLQPEAGAELIVSFGLTSYSNIFQETEGSEVSDVSRNFLSRLIYAQDGNLFSSQFDYQYLNRAYRDASLAREKATNGSSELYFGAESSPFRWRVSNQEQTLSNSAVRRNTLENLGQRSIYSTGPDLQVRLSPVDTLNALATYDVVNVSDSDTDSERSTIEVSWRHELNAFSSMSLLGSAANIDAKNFDSLSYDQHEINMAFERFSRHLTLNTRLGFSTISSFAGQQDAEQVIYDISIAHSYQRSLLTFGSSQQLADSSIGNNLNFVPGIGDTFDISDDNFVLQKQVRHSLRWRHEISNRVESNLLFAKSIVDRLEVIGSRETEEMAFNIRFQATPMVSFLLSSSARNAEDNILDARQEQNLRSQALVESYIVGASLSAECEAENLHSRGDFEYKDQRFGCSLSYNFF